MVVVRLFRVEEKLTENKDIIAKTDFNYSVLTTFS
jgi:hypothetical protein